MQNLRHLTSTLGCQLVLCNIQSITECALPQWQDPAVPAITRGEEVSSRDGSNQEDLNPRGFCGVCWRTDGLVKEHVVLAPCAEQEERREPPHQPELNQQLKVCKRLHIFLAFRIARRAIQRS